MDLKTTEKKIAEMEASIRRDLSDAVKADENAKRYMERKKTLDSRVRKNQAVLSDLKNRRAVLTIEKEIGKMDETKLARLRELLGEHGDIFDKETSGGEDGKDKGETGYTADVEE